MTTTVTVHVGGKYRAHVKIAHAEGSQEEHSIDGDGIEGASGEQSFRLRNPADAIFKISEEPVE